MTAIVVPTGIITRPTTTTAVYYNSIYANDYRPTIQKYVIVVTTETMGISIIHLLVCVDLIR